MNYELKVKNISTNTFILTGKFLNKEIINNLKKFIKQNIDKELSYKTNVKGSFTGFKTLVENKDFIEFLKNIQENIKIIHSDNFVIHDAWGNICKLGDEVLEHNHTEISAFSGILYLTEGGPGTYFKEYDLLIDEEVGKYVLFHPLLKHSVKKIENDLERITIAFNMNQFKTWDYSKDITWVNK